MPDDQGGRGESRVILGVRGGQAKHNEDGVLTKSSECDAGASDKAVRGIRSGRGLPVIKIARRRTRVIIGALASGESKWRLVTL